MEKITAIAIIGMLGFIMNAQTAEQQQTRKE